jgi:hypothetical protein
VDEFVKEYFKEDVELMDAIENSPSDLNLWCEDERVLLCLVGFMGESGVRVRVRVRKYIYIWSASRYKFGRFLIINKEVILQFFQNYNMVLVPTLVQ